MLTILCGDALEQLKALPGESVQCCVTSPPYWGLRDYGVTGQMGLEKTPEEYVAKMVAVFREVRRVLREDGTAWVNMGDSYSGSGEGGGGNRKGNEHGQHDAMLGKRGDSGLKPKDLCGIPWRLAFALQQSYEHCLIKDRADRAWLAGIIDGEGCVTSNEVITSMEEGRAQSPSYPIILQVRMSDREGLEQIVAITGVSKVQAEHLSPSQIGTLQRPPSCWKTSGENAASILAECYPYLTVKRKQALVAWNLQRLKDGIETRRGLTIPKENLEKRAQLFSVIRELNQRRPVDIPSWCQIPQIKCEPGWYLRSDCIWHKPNPMPESVTDRPTKSHEYIFLMSKSQRYYYDAEAVKEPVSGTAHKRQPLNGKPASMAFKMEVAGKGNRNNPSFQGYMQDLDPELGRNCRSVWTVPSQAYPESHFATFPEDLIKPCILAGTSARGCCPKCGAGWERIVSSSKSFESGSGRSGNPINGKQNLRASATNSTPDIRMGPTVSTVTTGWQPTCSCYPTDPKPCFDPLAVPCTVLDPFAGSGTTGQVALELGRKAILIEINPKYVELIRRRCNVTPGLQLA